LQSQFGLAVAMNVNGQRILIGDPALQTVYLYDHRGHLLHTFQDPDYEKGGFLETMFGFSLAMSDDGRVIAIGAPGSYSYDNHVAAGVVYLYHQQSDDNPTKWIKSDPIYKPGDVHGNENFGNSIALSADGSILLIGAWQDSANTGAAYLFRMAQQSENVLLPELRHAFLSPQDSIASAFGWAVDLTDEFAFIGAKGANRDHKEDAGAVYVYDLLVAEEQTEEAYPLIETIAQTMPGKNVEFGGAVSAAGNRLLVASYGRGTAYWYERETVYVEAQKSHRTYFVMKQEISIPSITSAGSSHIFGAAVALSRDGTKGVLGVPRALGKSGYVTSGTAMGLCLPERNDNDGVHYTCPALQLPSVSWTSKSFWFSWDSDSGKILAFVGTILVCLFILFYGTKRQRNQRRHRFQLVSAQAVNEYEMELRVIREDTEFL
jgi:hypothetical protein